jgi:hypothetical protein
LSAKAFVDTPSKGVGANLALASVEGASD